MSQILQRDADEDFELTENKGKTMQVKHTMTKSLVEEETSR